MIAILKSFGFSAAFVIALLAGGCSSDGKDEVASSSASDPTEASSDSGENWICGDRLPKPESDTGPVQIDLRHTEVTTVEAPLVPESSDGVVQMGTIEGIRIVVDVTNTAEDVVSVRDRFVVSRLAASESLIIVSDIYPQFSPDGLEPPSQIGGPPREIGPGETMSFDDIVIGIDEHTTCDRTDLHAGTYVLMIEFEVQTSDAEKPQIIRPQFEIGIP